MSNSSKQRLPSDGDAGQPQNNRQTRINPTIPRFSGIVNPHDPLPFDAELPPYPLPVSGGKLAWAIQDTIATLLSELKARGLDLPEEQVDQAVANTWVCMASSDYVAGRLRTWGNRQWYEGMVKHLTALREQQRNEAAQ